MPADYKQMARDLKQFYGFAGKTVVGVGAGNGPFTDLVCEASRLIVVDNNPGAICQWQTKIAAEGLESRVSLIEGDFCDTSTGGDVVYFEFCLHEMDDPGRALRHALNLAPEVVVFDHLPDSEWAFHAAEEVKIRRSADALANCNRLRHQEFRTEQRFENYQQLVDKVSCQGGVALQRAERYRAASEIAIPMTYALSLLRRESP